MTPEPARAVAILSAVRTPFGKFGGSLRSVPAPQLGAVAARSALARSGLAAPEIEEVLFGHCIQAGTGQNPARQVLRASGIPDSSGAATINMVCGSGMKAIHLGYATIVAGEASRLLVGGMECMSQSPYLVSSEVRWGIKAGARTMEDAMQRDSLTDAFAEREQMGLTGERIARKLGLSRGEVDAFALRSHQRATRASASGAFRAEMVPVPAGIVPGAPGLDRDETLRPETTLSGLSALKPAFAPGGLLTAGNSSKISDGAAALVLASAKEVAERHLTPLAWIHSTCVSGVSPEDVMESPIPTVRKHLARTGFAPGDFDRVEHNEAYASASIAFQRAFEFAEDRFNVCGGAIALGHPIGASGARMVVTLVHELQRDQGRYGLAALCMGGGNGLSLIVERPGA